MVYPRKCTDVMRAPKLELSTNAIVNRASGMTRAKSSTGLRFGGELIARCPSLPLLQQEQRVDRSKAVDSKLAKPWKKTELSKALQEATSKRPLQAGVTVQIGDQKFDIVTKLGQGSFGSVWSASSRCSKPIAVKEIFCRKQSVDSTMYEAKVLADLARKLPSSVNKFLPALFETEIASAGLDKTRIRMAMTRMPGVSISSFLKNQYDKDEFVDERCILRRLESACGRSRQLILQLSSAFEHISEAIFHRDVNCQNLMIDAKGDISHFSIIDFGLATCATKWRYDVQSDLRRCDVVGQGCFWPASCWAGFAHGPQELMNNQALRFEFAECLDVHGLGMVAMKILADALQSLSKHSRMENDLLDGGLTSKLLAIQSAWESYWRTTSAWWQRIIQAAGQPGGMQFIKASMVKCSVYKTVMNDLKRLNTSIKDASVAAKSATSNGIAGLARLLDTISDMISGSEQPLNRPNWRKIHWSAGGFDALCSARCNSKESVASSIASPSTCTPDSSAPFQGSGVSSSAVETSR